ncbi:MAG: hypothetical protein ABSE43_11860 [Steroidobacteraceae bacterium]
MIKFYGVAFLLGAIGSACAEEAKPAFPVMAPVEQYLEASASAEIAMARSAAPTSISGDASVLVLGNHGYETAVKGKNGFVCLVWRSWVSWAPGDDDQEFWNPEFRAPICFNPAGARSVLPAYLERTQWALSGTSKAEMKERTRVAIASSRMAMPEPGALGFMMGNEGGYAVGHDFHHFSTPHVMIFLARTDSADWGAGLRGSPIIAEQSDPEPITVFDVMVPFFSDGTPKLPKSMDAHSEMPLLQGGRSSSIQR